MTTPQPSQFRDHANTPFDRVRDTYRLNHEGQTLDFVLAKKRDYAPLKRARLGVWDALLKLEGFIDNSDPDTESSQVTHALQTAEAMRADGQPDWFVLTGLVHDLGKMLCLFGEPQWAVVGDTFPVGCDFAEEIIYHEYFANNPDRKDPRMGSQNGIYESGCGLDAVHMSWGHDEYLYMVLKNYLPEAASYVIRYHSFYPAHTNGAYTHLMNDRDRQMFEWVRKFNPYDLYSKSPDPLKIEPLLPHYRKLVDDHLPPILDW